MRKRVIFEYAIVLIQSGQMDMIYDGVYYTLRAGEVVLLRPGHLHSLNVEATMQVSQPHVVFDPIYDPSREKVYISFAPPEEMTPEERSWILPDRLFPEIPFRFCPADFPAYERRLLQLIDCYASNDPASILTCKALLLELLAMMLQENGKKMTESRRGYETQLLTIQTYIEHNYAQKLTLDKLANQFFMDKYHMSKLFTKTFGQPIMQYHRAVLLRHAKQMLRDGISVTETAYLLGFDNIYAFSRFFRKQTGISPTDYKKTATE